MDVLKLNTKAQRNLSLEDLKEIYSEEELERLIGKRDVYEKELTSDKYIESWEAYKEETSSLNKLHKWSPEEDAFLRACYMYLSDNTMALALNIPAYNVTQRRLSLKLIKGYTLPIDVIVWCKRDSYEEDLKKERLTKARPEIREAVKAPRDG